jgi:hypothetical protein
VGKQVLSNMPTGDQLPAEFGERRVRPIVDDLLSWLGVRILNEEEWEDGLRSTLEEMTDEALFILFDRRLQIEIRPHDCCRAVWAYLPMHRHMWLADYIDLKATTQVLLMISATLVEDRPAKLFEKLLRHQIGHVLRYLQHPTWPNECYHATREWKRWSKPAQSNTQHSHRKGLDH